jgi:hypothetical protein
LRPLASIGHSGPGRRGGAVGTLLLEGLAVRALASITAIGALAAVLTRSTIATVLVGLLGSGGGRHSGCRYQGGCCHQEFE